METSDSFPWRNSTNCCGLIYFRLLLFTISAPCLEASLRHFLTCLEHIIRKCGTAYSLLRTLLVGFLRSKTCSLLHSAGPEGHIRALLMPMMETAGLLPHFPLTAAALNHKTDEITCLLIPAIRGRAGNSPEERPSSLEQAAPEACVPLAFSTSHQADCLTLILQVIYQQLSCRSWPSALQQWR